MVNILVLLEFISGIIKRLSLSDDELNSVGKKFPETESKSTNEGSNLVNALKKYVNMYFDDYYQIRGFQDVEYRNVLEEIGNEIMKDPAAIEFQIENLKQFQSFSKAMHKMIIKNLKTTDEEEAPE